MPMTCNSCGVKLFGQEITAGLCENCHDGGYSARSPAPRTAPPPERFTEGYDARNAPGSEWRLFRLGLFTLQAATGAFVLVQVGAGLVLLLLLADTGTATLAVVGAMLLAVLMLCSCVLWLVGQGMLCGAPAGGVRTLALASACSTGLSILIFLGLIGLAGLGALKSAPGGGGLWTPPASGPDEIPLGMILTAWGGMAFFQLVAFICLMSLCIVAAKQLGSEALSLQFVFLLVVSFGVPLLWLGVALLNSVAMLFFQLAVAFGLSLWLLVLLYGLARQCVGR
jgi:hypothetical protein